MSIRKPPKIRKSISIRWQEGFGITEVMISAGILSVMALGMASLSEMVNRNQVINRTISSRDDLKTSVDRFTKNFSALKNSALNPAITDPGNLKFRSCLTGIPTAVPCDNAETPFILLGPLVGTGAFPQSTTPYSGDFDQNGAPCAAPGPNCPIVIRTTFTCPAPCTTGSQVFQIGYTIDGAPGVKTIRHIDTVGRTFEAIGPSISSANPSSGTANTLVKWDATGNNIGSSQVIEDSGGQVGIGISTPTSPLTLKANDATGRSLEIRGRNSDNAFWLFLASGDGSIQYGSLQGNSMSGITLAAESGNLTFTNNGNQMGGTSEISFRTIEVGQGSYIERMAIKPNGKLVIATRVGIGTTDPALPPAAPLTVVGNGEGILMRAGPATNNRLKLFVDGVTEENYIVSMNTNLRFLFGFSGSEEKVTFTNSGKVGIGISNPQATLDVNGTARLAKNSTEPYACVAPHDGTIALTAGYGICTCKVGTGWISTSGGSACNWIGGGGGAMNVTLANCVDVPAPASGGACPGNQVQAGDTGAQAGCFPFACMRCCDLVITPP